MIKFSGLSKLSRLLTMLSLVAISCAFITTSHNAKTDIADVAKASQSPIMVRGSVRLLSSPVGATSARTTLANFKETTAFTPHSDACLANYNQCIKGCDGATSCSKQCKTNYDDCMKQEGVR
jgi:hypothetical protein